MSGEETVYVGISKDRQQENNGKSERTERGGSESVCV